VQGKNQFPGDRAAYWINVAASGEPADDLRGKNLAALILHLPTFAVVAMGTAAITGGWAYIPSAACLGVAVLGCQFGLGNVTSVRFAQPLPQAATNPWGVRSGQSIGTGFVLLGAFLLSGLLLAPPAVLAGVGASHPAVLWIAGPVSVAYGVAAYAIGMHISGSWLRTHQPELLGALSPSRAA